ARPSMHQRARFGRTDPTRVAARRGDATVERGRKLECDERTPAFDPRKETFVEAAALLLQHTFTDCDTRRTKNRQTAPAHRRIGISASCHHARNSRIDQ